MTQDDAHRFWSRVQRGDTDECWLWTAGLSSNGYGAFSFNGKHIGSHRMAALLAYGPSTAYTLHSCDNKLCCNPRHLRYGTQKDNVRDAIERGQYRPPPPGKKGRAQTLFGKDVWNNSLNEDIVRRIWRLHFEGKNTAEITTITGVGRHPIADVCRGKNWRHLSGAPSIDELAKGGVRRAKLSPDDIRQAKSMINAGMSNKEIAKHFGISPTPISILRNHGRTW